MMCTFFTSMRRNLDHYFRALAWLTLNRKTRSHLFGPLMHTEQPQMRTSVVRGRAGIKSLPIILNPEQERSWLVIQFNTDFFRSRIFQRIGDGFLADSQQMIFNL